MIRNLEETPFENGKRFIRAAGLSTDQKPTKGIITGSQFLEVDKRVCTAYDEENDAWEYLSGNVEVDPLTVTVNGTITAPNGKAYNPVTVNVANSYTASDEGKVVSDGALVSQTSTTKNANGTYDTTLNNEVVVDVPNSYSAGDEGKVVSNGALVAQTAHAEVTSNGTIDTTLNNSVTVNVSGGGGGGSVAANAVNFYDYDGTIVAAYTAADFANLTALPANPSHDGLTAQGWNWTLAYAKTYVASYGRLNIGQMYITDDGKTRVYIHLEEGRLSPMLGVYLNGTVDVDWGDGTTHDTLTGTSIYTVKWTPNHAYAAPGDYVIKLTVTGSMEFYGSSSDNQCSGLLRYTSSGDGRNSVYQNAIKKVEIGSGVTSIGNYAFYSCYSLENITLPDSVTSIGSYTFNNCYSLANIIIPDSVTSIGTYAFRSCSSLTSITLPSGVTSIGGSAFQNCSSLSSITIPSDVTSISDSAFRGCSSLSSITIPSGVTSIDSSAFYYCSSLSSITIPSSVTSIGTYAFYYCYSLSSITLPSGVTSIGTYAFSYCSSLSSITIPSSVTSIGNSAFQGCYSPAELHFKPTSPPTAGGSAFPNLPTDCKIYVPTGSLTAYTSANNYPSSSTYTYVEE